MESRGPQVGQGESVLTTEWNDKKTFSMTIAFFLLVVGFHLEVLGGLLPALCSGSLAVVLRRSCSRRD